MAQTTNTNKHKKLELSIQVHLSGLSFCILNKDDETIDYIKHHSFGKKLNPFEVLEKLKEFFDSDNALQRPFTNVVVVHDNELSTLVAKPLFDKDSLADYLKFNAKILNSDFIAYDNLDTSNCVNVYVPYVNINNFIYDKFGEFTYKHASTVLIDSIISLKEPSDEKVAYVHVGQGHFEILISEKRNVLLYNTFQFTTKEDFIYYILFTFEQLQLNPETQRLMLLGAISSEDPLFEMVYKYVRHVNVFNASKSSESLQGVDQNFIISNSL